MNNEGSEAVKCDKCKKSVEKLQESTVTDSLLLCLKCWGEEFEKEKAKN